MRYFSLAGIVLAFVCATPGFAGIAIIGSEKYDRERTEQTEQLIEAIDLYHSASRDHAPGLVEPLIDYDERMSVASACDPARKPRTHAVLVGSDDIGLGIRMQGPVNDVELLSSLLVQLGVEQSNLHVLLGEHATRDELRNSLTMIFDTVGCDDRVLLHFSTMSVPLHTLLDQHVLNRGDHEGRVLELAERGLPRSEISVGTTRLNPRIPDAQKYFVENVFTNPFAEVAILLTDDRADFSEVVLGRDIADYTIAVRNRGAHMVVSLDIGNAAAASIQERQRAAGDGSAWVFDYATSEDEPSHRYMLLPGHGHFSVFYAADAVSQPPELALPPGDQDAKIYGLFSFYFAHGLISTPGATPRTISETIRRSYAGISGNSSKPRIESSDPDLPLIAEAATPNVNGQVIRILNPTPKRGAMKVERQELEIDGIVEWPARVLGVHIDQQPALLRADGHFSGKIQLKNGMNTINVMAITADSRMHVQTLEFVYEGDRRALEGEGKRYAIVVANQNYGGTTGFSTLATPFADADALVTVLKDRYGFETELALPNGSMSLVLKDPTKRDIQLALHQIGRMAGEKDTVLIYYAGHGVFEPVTSSAYWVPADAEAGFEPSYLSAADISAAIQRIQAGSVMLISDSCYSGALIRGEAAEEKVEEAERLQSLLRMQARRSRVVITSGNNEPVEDLGGRGHSVFARALLTGLESMDEDAFSSRELFDGYILHAVTANADQEPQYRPLEKVGHEGGDFVFVRLDQQQPAAP